MQPGILEVGRRIDRREPTRIGKSAWHTASPLAPTAVQRVAGEPTRELWVCVLLKGRRLGVEVFCFVDDHCGCLGLEFDSGLRAPTDVPFRFSGQLAPLGSGVTKSGSHPHPWNGVRWGTSL